MKFLFTCPETQKTFELETEGFRIIENKGISEDKDGNRVLNVKVELSSPCPMCGKMHTYNASELACPLT